MTTPQEDIHTHLSLENDSPSRGRKHNSLSFLTIQNPRFGLENDSPSRGRKRERIMLDGYGTHKGLENDSPSRGRKL